MPDGTTATRDYQVHPGSVAVLALDDEGRVLVLRQYRHPVRHKLWEIPAGLLDIPGENPLHAAQRELYEEAHVKAEDWRVLIDVYTSPGGSDEAVRIFLARDVSEADGERFEVSEEEADMEVARVPARRTWSAAPWPASCTTPAWSSVSSRSRPRSTARAPTALRAGGGAVARPVRSLSDDPMG